MSHNQASYHSTPPVSTSSGGDHCTPQCSLDASALPSVQRQDRDLHHCSSSVSGTCRFFAYMLGILAHFFCNQHEACSVQVCLARLVLVLVPARQRRRGGEMGKEGFRGVAICNCLNKSMPLRYPGG